MDDAALRPAPNAPQARSRDAAGLEEGEPAMNLAPVARTQPAPLPASMVGCYELRFESLFNPGRALAFPCDARGRVEMDSLSETALRNYLYARAVVGREFATPAVVLS
jgi:hypothetical protein